MQVNEQKLHARLEASDRRLETLAREQQLLIMALSHRMDRANAHSSVGNTASSGIVLRLDWIRTFADYVNGLVQGIFVMTFANFRMLVDIRDRLPSRLERSLYQEPFILEDAHGRIFPVPMQFINSWEIFEHALTERFRGIKGSRMVQQKQYVLHDSAANQDIRRERPWEGAFSPGQRVVMCMLFVEPIESQSCPKCNYLPTMEIESDIKWYVTTNSLS